MNEVIAEGLEFFQEHVTKIDSESQMNAILIWREISDELTLEERADIGIQWSWFKMDKKKVAGLVNQIERLIVKYKTKE